MQQFRLFELSPPNNVYVKSLVTNSLTLLSTKKNIAKSQLSKKESIVQIFLTLIMNEMGKNSDLSLNANTFSLYFDEAISLNVIFCLTRLRSNDAQNSPVN